jgi:exodeoxyribonuclease VIII
MLDIETLSTKTNAAIVQIGAVKFSLDKGIIGSFKINVCPVDCKKHGLDIEQSTVDWWLTQSKEARNSWRSNPETLHVALEYFVNWYGRSKLTWAKGGQKFDFPILENALRECNMDVPWKYWDCMDYRTLITVLGIDDRKLKSEGSVYHDALSDCEEQVKVLLPLLKALRGDND